MADGVLPPLEQFLGRQNGASVPTTAAAIAGIPNLPSRFGIRPTTIGEVYSNMPTTMEVIGEDNTKITVDLNRAKESLPHVPPHAHASRADAAAAAYYGIAEKQAGTVRGRSTAGEPVVRTLPDQNARNVGRPELPPAGVPPRRAASGYVEQNVQRRPQVVSAPRQLEQPVPQPGQPVTFDVPGFGLLDVEFQKVVRSRDHLVLVADARLRKPGFPQHSDRDLGLRVGGTDILYVVRTTGIEFELDGKRVCVLSITQEGSYEDFAASTDEPVEEYHGGPRDVPQAVESDPDYASDHDETPGF